MSNDAPDYYTFGELVKLINKIELIDLITQIETIDMINDIGDIANIANIESIDLIDKITLIDELTTIGTIDTVTKIDEILKIGSIESGYLLRNHGFELGDLTGWTPISGNEIIDLNESKYGNYSCKVLAGSGTRGMIQYFKNPIPAYLIRSVKCWMKSTGVIPAVSFGVIYTLGSSSATSVASQTIWQQKTLAAALDITSDVMGIIITVDNPSYDIFLDHFTVTLKDQKLFGNENRVFPQESVSPYEPQVSINQENIGLITKIGELETWLEGLYGKLNQQAQLISLIYTLLGTGINVTEQNPIPEVPTAVLADAKTVAASATPEALGSGALKNSVLIQAKTDNTDTIYVGNDTNQEVELEAGDSMVVVADNLDDIYIKVAVNGEGVNYIGG